MRIYLLLAFIFLFAECNNSGDKKEITDSVTLPPGAPPKPQAGLQTNPTPDQIARKEKSEAYCKAYNVKINKTLPYVGAEDSVSLRTVNEIVDRIFALCYVEIKSEGAPSNDLDGLDKKYNILKKLSPEEKEFADAENPSDKQMSKMNWRAEDIHVLLWALGFVDSLGSPENACDVASDMKLIFPNSEKEFRAKAKLRSKKEILDANDWIYRIDWACTDARVNNEAAPAGFDGEVVFEWHYALNWLIIYMNEDWDDVSPDT